MSTFEAEVLAHLDDINKRLSSIELKVSGAEDDPHNRGIFGALTEIKEHRREDLNTINVEQRRITDDIIFVKKEQAKQKAWSKGAASASAVNAAGVVAVLAKLNGAF